MAENRILCSSREYPEWELDKGAAAESTGASTSLSRGFPSWD